MTDAGAPPQQGGMDPGRVLRGTAMAGWLTPTTESRVDQILVAEIEDRAWPSDPQPPAEAAGLRSSIAARGVIEPVLLRRRPGGGFQVVAGQRRLEAARELGHLRLPAIVRSLGDREAVLIAAWSTLERRRVDHAAALLPALHMAGLSLDELRALAGREEAPPLPPAAPFLLLPLPLGAPRRRRALPRFTGAAARVLPPLPPAELAAGLRGLRLLSPAAILR